MRLTVLGCAGSFPGPESACSSYLVEHDGFRLLVDLGNGALGPLQRICGLYDVDAVIITHLHSDHCIDLVPWAVALRYAVERRPLLPVYGPPATRDRIASAYLCPPGDCLDDVYSYRSLAAGTVTVGPFEVTTALMAHPLETYGLRLSAGGRTLAYSADTGATPALVELARDVDLLLAEASFLDGADNPPNLHLTGREAGEHATLAGARRLLLTHLVSWGDEDRTLAEAVSAYDGPVELARSCTSYDV